MMALIREHDVYKQVDKELNLDTMTVGVSSRLSLLKSWVLWWLKKNFRAP